jgi:hypothetical protein
MPCISLSSCIRLWLSSEEGTDPPTGFHSDFGNSHILRQNAESSLIASYFFLFQQSKCSSSGRLGPRSSVGSRREGCGGLGMG